MDTKRNSSVPEDFKYKKVYEKGKPVHTADDPFFIRHPKMDPSRRAKLFAPFDALRGFSAAVIAEEERYASESDMDTQLPGEDDEDPRL